MGKCNNTNKYIIYETHAEIVLYDKQGNEKCRVLIDNEDIQMLKEYTWYLHKNGYIISNTGSKNGIKIHRLIMNAPEDKVVDHISHNKLDNRKSNLRICTQSENTMNKSKHKNNTSGVTGVGWYKKYNKWRARIDVNKKSILLGYFDTYEEAVESRRKAEIKYFGEYRNKNN